jgi:hypothetical protein
MENAKLVNFLVYLTIFVVFVFLEFMKCKKNWSIFDEPTKFVWGFVGFNENPLIFIDIVIHGQNHNSI